MHYRLVQPECGAHVVRANGVMSLLSRLILWFIQIIGFQAASRAGGLGESFCSLFEEEIETPSPEDETRIQDS